MASMVKYVENLSCVSSLCNVIDRVLTEKGTQVGKVLTYKVGGTNLAKKMPILFKGVENPHLKFGYEGNNKFFIHVMDGKNPVRKINYNKVNGVYHADISSPTESLNCIFDPSKELYNPSRSAFRLSSGANGTSEDSVGVLLNLNDSAARVEGVVNRPRLGRLGNILPNKGSFELASGVEGVAPGKTRFKVEYHDSKGDIEVKNSTLKRFFGFFSNKSA